ncbi:MAG: NAD(P)-dependent oxidoreductase [Candidatus Puniceispirillaceae bacterium]
MAIGFIGLGKMGAAMAPHLAMAGHRVIGHDLVKPPVLPDGVDFTPDLGSLVGCQIIIAMLPDGDVVETVVTSLLERGCGADVVDMSSSHPDVSRRLHSTLAAHGQAFVDAPVSGGVGRAETAELQIMVGGDEVDVMSLAPVLSCMGHVTHMGPAGCGHAMKALNNYVSAAGLIASFEALATAGQLGIDEERFVEVINRSTGRNNTTEAKIARYVLSGAFDSGFALKLMAKDVMIAESLASAAGFDGPVTGAVRGFLDDELASLGEAADHTELYLSVTKGAKDG